MSDINLSLSYTPQQKEVFFNNTARFTTIEKGRRFGFTKGMANACIEWLLEGKKVLWVDTITSNLQRYYERYFLPELKALPKELYKFHSQDKKLSINEGYLDMRSAERPENIEGFGYDIVILNEAGIILKNAYLWDNAISPMLLDNPNSRAFIGGVPKGKNKFFQLAQKGMREEKEWKNFQFSSYDNPLLKKEEINRLVADLGGIDSDVARQEIFGEFLDTTSNALFNLSLIENAFLKEQFINNDDVIFGLDVAREGDDFSVLCIRKGYNVLDFHRYQIPDTTQLAREIFGVYQRSDIKPVAIFVDSVGVGAGVYDRLREFGLGAVVREAKGSFKATQENRYANKRAEMYFTLRDKFKLLAIKPNDMLKKQLQAISFFFDKKERYLLMPKESIKKEFGFSPDFADALAMTFFDTLIPKNDVDMYEEGDIW